METLLLDQLEVALYVVATVAVAVEGLLEIFSPWFDSIRHNLDKFKIKYATQWTKTITILLGMALGYGIAHFADIDLFLGAPFYFPLWLNNLIFAVIASFGSRFAHGAVEFFAKFKQYILAIKK